VLIHQFCAHYRSRPSTRKVRSTGFQSLEKLRDEIVVVTDRRAPRRSRGDDRRKDVST
jgi:hypothetical protein